MLLECSDLSVSYGKIAAVRGVSLQIAEGQIVTIVGPNGAGKSTLLSALMGLLPCSGPVAYFGRARKPAPSTEALVRLGLGLIPENRELFAPMSIDDNLRLGAFDRWRAGARDMEASLAEVFALFPRLEERRAQPAGTLSGGERQMLAIGRALMGRPKLLMLDEPSLGLAPLIVRDIFEIIKSLRARGVSVLLIEQNARAAINISDYGYVMEAGEFVLQGSAAELANNAKVIETYLGVSSAAKAES
ncbi:MAG: ABC transporter ATP-binding protein [Rhodopseudomonas sp.]|uniref:ABC transporter ATP-binding protein n=1 Tax=Rhodopseudomonas sp. TaxID=1078 RepID=UPI0018092924|nr:ABC transporter ATP-binding protein [Rhodopseudomonas sp.]NVN85494.1 ABC transporter ATP-binding protein [Rhodopseudomonas sp.]